MNRFLALLLTAIPLFGQSTLATFSFTEPTGVNWPVQPIEFAYAGGQPSIGTTRLMLAINGGAQAEVPYSWAATGGTSTTGGTCASGCIITETAMTANLPYVWTLQSGIAPTVAPTHPAAIATVGSNYELTNGLTGLRVPTAASNTTPYNKAPVQGCQLPSATWSCVGTSPNLIYTESAGNAGNVGVGLFTAAYSATGYSCATTANGQMYVQLSCTYTFTRPHYCYGACTGSNTITPAGSGHYTFTATLYADATSVVIDEDSDMMFRWFLPVIGQLIPDTIRWKGHDSIDSSSTPNPYCGYDTVGTVSGATNATPIVVTWSGTLPNNGERVLIASVGGNTAANGLNYAKKISANTFSLYSDSGLTAAVTGNGAYTSGGTVKPTYQGWAEADPALEAFQDIVLTADSPAALQCKPIQSGGGGYSYAKVMTANATAAHAAGWYSYLYNSAGGGSSPVIGVASGDSQYSWWNYLGPSQPGVYTSNAHFITLTTAAGYQVDNLLRAPTGYTVGVPNPPNAPPGYTVPTPNLYVVHKNWLLYTDSLANIGAANAFQPIMSEQNFKVGEGLTKLYADQLSFSDPGGGWQYLYLPTAAANTIISRVQNGTSVCGSANCYYTWLKDGSTSQGITILDMWQGNSSGAVGTALGNVTTAMSTLGTTLAAGDNKWDDTLGYYQLGLLTSPETVLINAILCNTNSTTAQKTAAKAALALFGLLFWDNTWFPFDVYSGDSEGLTNQQSQYGQYRAQSAGAAATQPVLATKLTQAAGYVTSGFANTFNTQGAPYCNTWYSGACFESLETNYFTLVQAGSLNMSSPSWIPYANWELSTLTPLEPRFGNPRKSYSNGDGNTAAYPRAGMLATALADATTGADATTAAKLMWAYNATLNTGVTAYGYTQDNQFLPTWLAVDPTISAVTPTIGSINVPGYHSAERAAFGTVHEDTVHFINGGFYSAGGHRHYDDGQVSIYAHNAPLGIDWNANLYSPETPGRFVHNSVTFDAEITGGPTWSSDNVPLTTASRFLTAPTNTEFQSFANSTISTATFGFFGVTWTRTVKTFSPNTEYPIIEVEDTYTGSPTGQTVTWNLMATGAVTTPAGSITPTTRFSTGCQSPAGALPSNGAVNSLSTGLQHFSFTGQTWAAHPTGGINWDLYTVNPSGSAQFLIGNWGHGCQSQRETLEYEAANSTGSFAEVQDILRIHDTGATTTLILPYRKTETPTRTVTTAACGTQVVQGTETTCFNDSLETWTDGTTAIMTVMDNSSQTAGGITASGGPQELVSTTTAATWTMSGAASTTRTLTFPSGTWYPVPSSVGSPGTTFTYPFAGGLQATPAVVTFSQSASTGGSTIGGKVGAAGNVIIHIR